MAGEDNVWAHTHTHRGDYFNGHDSLLGVHVYDVLYAHMISAHNTAAYVL
jgi:hypothetical protein